SVVAVGSESALGAAEAVHMGAEGIKNGRSAGFGVPDVVRRDAPRYARGVGSEDAFVVATGGRRSGVRCPVGEFAPHSRLIGRHQVGACVGQIPPHCVACDVLKTPVTGGCCVGGIGLATTTTVVAGHQNSTARAIGDCTARARIDQRTGVGGVTSAPRTSS